jgi:hypothetical protein
MKYMLLIQHGDMPKPGSPEWKGLSADEQKAIYHGYKAIDETPGVTPGQWLENPGLATTVRVQDGETLTTDGPFVAAKEALNGYLFFEDRASLACPGRPVRRRGGGSPHQAELAIFKQFFYDQEVAASPALAASR